MLAVTKANASCGSELAPVGGQVARVIEERRAKAIEAAAPCSYRRAGFHFQRGQDRCFGEGGVKWSVGDAADVSFDVGFRSLLSR